MRFELLPNEILIECFEYLNAIDIFYSFDQLNYRFNQLIRSILLHLDFQHTQRSTFDEFCMKMVSNEDIKKQIYSLHLSNKDICYNIQPFVTLFSLDEFVQLRSLSLTWLTSNNKSKLKAVLPSLSQLICFQLIDSIDENSEILSALSMSPLRTLMISELPCDWHLTDTFPLLSNLTICECNFNRLFQGLKNASHLKYLSIKKLENTKYFTTPNDINLTNLKQLIIMDFQGKLDDVALILKQTPKLKSLTVSNYTNDKIDMMNACRWKHLITSSLPYLHTFKFKFECSFQNKDVTCEQLKEFQNDFWCKQHHWYTEYFLSDRSAMIYTIPYTFHTFNLRLKVSRYSNDLINNAEVFQNVENLIINPEILTESCRYYFSQVTSLILGIMSIRFHLYLMGLKELEYLKMIVNLSNVKYLAILSDCTLETTAVLKQLVKELPQLSSLKIIPDVLKSLIDDVELCKDLNTIKKLNIVYYRDNSSLRLFDSNKFCEIFSNVEQLTCSTDQSDTVLFFLKHLPKLSRMNISLMSFSFIFSIDTLEEELQKLSIRVINDCDTVCVGDLSFWIFRDMN